MTKENLILAPGSGGIELKLKNCFIEWQKDLNELQKKTFVRDGIFDEQKYSNSNHKVLFLNKEAYGFEEDNNNNNLITYIRDKGLKKDLMWKNVEIILKSIYLIKTEGEIPSFENVKNDRTDFFSCAVMNIKKYNGNPASDWDDLEKHFRVHKHDINVEIEILKPDIVFCGNVFYLFRQEFPNRFQPLPSTDFFYSEKGRDRIYIDYWHPAAYVFPQRMYYYTFAANFQKYLLWKKNLNNKL